MSELAKVWPKTLTLRKSADAKDQLVYIYGGKDEDVFVAAFVDQAEAESWILGSKQFGQEVIGVRHGATRVESGKVSHDNGGETGGGRVPKTREPGSQGGS